MDFTLRFLGYVFCRKPVGSIRVDGRLNDNFSMIQKVSHTAFIMNILEYGFCLEEIFYTLEYMLGICFFIHSGEESRR